MATDGAPERREPVQPGRDAGGLSQRLTEQVGRLLTSVVPTLNLQYVVTAFKAAKWLQGLVGSITVVIGIVMSYWTFSSGSQPMTAKDVLFSAIHDLALPQFGNSDAPRTERFILLNPGKVLNYYDYCPSKKLTPKERDKLPPSRLPPDENTFMLTDKLPAANPFGGGLTGRSLSTIYHDVLYTIDTTTSDLNPLNEGYYAAMQFLEAKVSDPKDPEGEKLPRFELYHRYEMEYYDAVATVKHWMATNKTALNAKYDDYVTWHHDNHDTLMAHVSAAYSQWLVNGQKSEVEEKIAIVDTRSARKEIQEAKRALQNGELPSMDGGSAYYPVHLEPTNWYEYLLARQYKATREQIQAKISELKTRLVQLESLMSPVLPSDDDIEKMNQPTRDLEKAQSDIQAAGRAVRCYEYLCHAEKALVKLSEDDPCKKIYQNPKPCEAANEFSAKLEEATQLAVKAQTDSDMMKNQLAAFESTNTNLEGARNNLQVKIADLERELESAPIHAPAINEAKGKSDITQKEIEQNWMLFSFDSRKYSSRKQHANKAFKIVIPSFSLGKFGFRAGSDGFSLSLKQKELGQNLSIADVSVTAKLLRVTIHRSWFRPSVFRISKSLKMKEGVAPVSPGPMVKESDFINVFSEYQLPEYTTGFLLAKDVCLVFRGMDTTTSNLALKESALSEFAGSYGPFSAAPSYSEGHEASNLEVSSQSDGLHVDIPGAQVIGYYTSVIPRFPDH